MTNSKKGAPDRPGQDKPPVERPTAEKVPPALRSRAEMLECDIPNELPVIPLASTEIGRASCRERV